MSKSQTMNSSVQFIDVLSEINKRIENLEKRPTCAVTQLRSAEAGTVKFSSPSHFIVLSSNPSLDYFASRFIDSVFSESLRRIRKTKTAVIFHTPDRLPREKVKETIMKP